MEAIVEHKGKHLKKFILELESKGSGQKERLAYLELVRIAEKGYGITLYDGMAKIILETDVDWVDENVEEHEKELPRLVIRTHGEQKYEDE